MQVLKEEMRKRIHEAALKEFSEKGFRNASVREIAKGAGMTVGNLYRYFDNKEALFYSVISPAYDSLMELVGQSLEQVGSGFGSGFFEGLAGRILKISREHRIELLILFEGSSGSKYEHAKEEMVQIVEGFLRGNILEQLASKGIGIEDVYLLRIIAVNFVEGMTMIGREYESGDRLKKVAEQYIAFYFSNVLDRFG
ncbi:MAG: TetR/AcrR family transcriptional regulator [Pseudomonadota bacterium]